MREKEAQRQKGDSVDEQKKKTEDGIPLLRDPGGKPGAGTSGR